MNNIERDSQKMFGMPSIINRRMTVYDVVTTIYYENDIHEALNRCGIDKDIATEALKYCSKQLCKFDDDGQLPFCDGCLLRDIAEGSFFDKSQYYEIMDDNNIVSTFSIDGVKVFNGSIEEFKEEEEGIETWKLAQSLLERW